jgi:uncharacterized protein DUF4340
VWLVLAVLVLGIAALEVIDRRQGMSGAGDAGPQWLLPVPLEQIGAVEIADRGRLHRFERDATGAWFYHGIHAATESTHTHIPDPALSARIDQALAAFGRARVERRFALDKDGGAYGVATPEILVLVYRPNEPQPLAQYAVGAIAPDTASRYVMRVGRPEVITIPNYQIDNLQALIRAAVESAPRGTAERR